MSQANMGDLLRQAGRLRKEMDRVQEELKDRFVEASSGGGIVGVTLNGHQELIKVSIDPKFFGDLAGKVDVDMLEDLIVAAVAQGHEKSKALMKAEMDKVSGGLGGLLPGMM